METPQRVLIVDNEAKILFVLERVLDTLGSECQVVCSGNAREALKLAQESRFDLVLTDLEMSQMDGITFTEALRALPYDPVVIWMTASCCRMASVDAKRLGVHRCLDKPIEVGEIRQIVREALEAPRDPN
jgi:CheY-like chemotaxis protein